MYIFAINYHTYFVKNTSVVVEQSKVLDLNESPDSFTLFKKADYWYVKTKD